MSIDDINKLKKYLPTVPGINGKDEYLNSVVLVLLMKIKDEYHIVFEERCANIRQGGEICFPGGRCEKDESIEMTVKRETQEEIGIPSERIQLIGRLDTVFAAMGAIVEVFVGITDYNFEDITINPFEVERVFALPISYFLNRKPDDYSIMIQVLPTYVDDDSKQEIVLLPSKELGLPERYQKPWGGYKSKVYVYQTEEGVIWGITARILRDFINRYHNIVS